MAEMSQTEQKYRECRDAIKGGKLVVISSGQRRDLISGVRTQGTKRDGGQLFIADTLSGPIPFDAATFKVFENVRDAQHELFGGGH